MYSLYFSYSLPPIFIAHCILTFYMSNLVSSFHCLGHARECIWFIFYVQEVGLMTTSVCSLYCGLCQIFKYIVFL